jgi:hypothetical protein
VHVELVHLRASMRVRVRVRVCACVCVCACLCADKIYVTMSQRPSDPPCTDAGEEAMASTPL